jgi:hypothetical protein
MPQLFIEIDKVVQCINAIYLLLFEFSKQLTECMLFTFS